MPALIFPAGFPFSNGDDFPADFLNSLFYDDTSDYIASLAIINGGLDEQNLAVGWEIQAEHTQRGSHIDMGSVARTANLDWRRSWFGGYAWTDPGTDELGDILSVGEVNAEPAKTVPGAAIEIHIKKTSQVLLMWEVFWMNDSIQQDATAKSVMFLVVDGLHVPAQWRTVGQTHIAEVPKGYEKARAWSGQVLVEMDEGWHSAEIRLISEGGTEPIAQVRTWASSMKYVAFTHSGA